MRTLLITMVGAGLAGSLLSAADQTAKAPGKKIFDSKCVLCHGSDGKGKQTMAKSMKVNLAEMDLTSVNTASKKDEDLLKIIAEGKEKMPAYGKQLKEDELKAVLQTIRSLSTPKK